MRFPKSNRDDLCSTINSPGPGAYSKLERPSSAGPKYGFGTS